MFGAQTSQTLNLCFHSLGALAIASLRKCRSFLQLVERQTPSGEERRANCARIREARTSKPSAKPTESLRGGGGENPLLVQIHERIFQGLT